MTSIRTLSIVATAFAMPFLTAVRTRRYIAGGRGKGEPDTGTNHVGVPAGTGCGEGKGVTPLNEIGPGA